jgi:3',5'-cyclic AMP phosphodiesterase CpdA
VREAYSDATKAAFMLHAGDLINRGTNDAEWGEWFYASGHIHRMTPCFPTPGNHEYSKVKNVGQLTPHWQAMFTLPENGPPGLKESVYWTDFQGTRFISLNSNEKQEEQVQWVSEVLSSNQSKWTILTFHHPIYSASKGRDNKALRELWQPVFDKFRVDLVLQGHDHSYARSGLMTYQNVATGASNRSETAGTVYVVSVSGPKMYGVDREPFMKRAAENTQLYQVITVDADELRYSAYTANGTLYDAFVLRKRTGQINELIEKVPPTPERRHGNTDASRKAS